MKTIAALFGISSLASTWLAGALGLVVVAQVGPYLAMGAHMYTGNTEPTQPEVALPWVIIAVTALVPLPLAARKRWIWAAAAAIPFALLPWWLLAGLYRAAG